MEIEEFHECKLQFRMDSPQLKYEKKWKVLRAEIYL